MRQEVAREMFLKADSNRRLKEAQKNRIQSYTDQKYEEGDLIIYKEKNDN